MIRTTRFDSAIGLLLLAATPKGLCGLRLMHEEREVEIAWADLRRRFPGEEVIEADDALSDLVAQVRRVLAGEEPASTIALDMPGTDFQRRVWEALVDIPWGRTCTYAELAQRAGKPRAVRAAASACARNPVAFVVPCHRVVRGGGGLGGYFYGVALKKQLLERERLERERGAELVRMGA